MDWNSLDASSGTAAAAAAAAAGTVLAGVMVGMCRCFPFNDTCVKGYEPTSQTITKNPATSIHGRAHGTRVRRHKVVRDLEWVWCSPNIFSAELKECPGLGDSICAIIAADPRCICWLEQLDTAPAPLIQFLGHDPALPLGFYFAKLLEYWLRCCPSLEVEDGSLRVNQAITTPSDGKTVGQLKYIFRCQRFRERLASTVPPAARAVQLHHWEASVKFFLRVAPTYTVATSNTREKGQVQVQTPEKGQLESNTKIDAERLDTAQINSCVQGTNVVRDRGRALRRAAGDSDPSKLAAILDADEWNSSALDATTDGSGKSAIHQAAWRGNIENLKMLLDRGCSTEAIATGEFSYGKTPLFFAITRNRDEIVRLLLERGASTRVVNNKGQTPLSLGFSHLRDDTLQILRKHEEAEVVPWRNFRLSHSDGLVYQLLSIFRRCRYGDLDPRFLDTAPGMDDVVTEYSVNPTTRLSRKGNFERNNSAAMVDNARARAAHGYSGVHRLDGNGIVQAPSLGALENGESDAEISASDCCLGLYVGPSLHENLAWRVREAQRKMKLSQPGGVGYLWLENTDSLIVTSKTKEDDNNEAAKQPPDTAFICKGFLFELVAPVELLANATAGMISSDRTGSLTQLLPRPRAAVFCQAVSTEHLAGWWSEWPELKQRFKLIRNIESKDFCCLKVRWAVLTKRHWLAPAVARTNEVGNICVDGEAAVGIESLPTFSTGELAEQLQPHFEKIKTNPIARPQPMLLACLLEQQDKDRHKNEQRKGEDEEGETGYHPSSRQAVWFEHSRGFVVVSGWSVQAGPMVSDGTPLVRKDKDGHHDTMVAPDATGAVVTRRVKRQRRQKKTKSAPKSIEPPEALVGMSGGADALSVLRHALLNPQQDLSGDYAVEKHANSDQIMRKQKKQSGSKCARALRSNRELWRQKLKALLLNMPSGEEAARWVWDCLCGLDASADKQDRAVAGLLLDALSDTILALLLVSDVDGPANGSSAHTNTAVGKPDLAGQCLRDLSKTTLEASGIDDSWARSIHVRFALAVVGETDEASGYLRIGFPAGAEAVQQVSEVATAHEKASLRWSCVLSQVGGPEQVARVASSLLLVENATTLEAGARLATKPQIAAALPSALVFAASSALLKRGSFKLLALLVKRLCEVDTAAGARLTRELLATAAPKSAQRLASALGAEASPLLRPQTQGPDSAAVFGLTCDRQENGDESAVLPWLTLSIPVKLAETVAQCEVAVKELAASLPAGGLRAIGLDTEWGDCSKERPKSVLLQIATETHCVLVRLEEILGTASRLLMADRCPALAELLADATVAKAGVGVGKDAELLESEWNLCCRSTVELSSLAQAAGLVHSRHGVGLASLTRFMLKRNLRKTKSLRCGDWRAPVLSPEQIEYAALDAVAGHKILAAIWENGQRSNANTYSRNVVEFCNLLLMARKGVGHD